MALRHTNGGGLAIDRLGNQLILPGLDYSEVIQNRPAQANFWQWDERTRFCNPSARPDIYSERHV